MTMRTSSRPEIPRQLDTAALVLQEGAGQGAAVGGGGGAGGVPNAPGTGDAAVARL